MLVSCGNDVKFHAIPNYDIAQVYMPNEHSGLVRSVSWSRDGTLLGMVPNKGYPEIVRTKDDLRLIQTISSVTQPTSIAFQKTTKKLVSLGTATGTILVYDIKQRAPKKTFAKSGPGIVMLEWNYKDTHLAVLKKDGQVSIYNNQTNQKTSTVQIDNKQTTSTIRFHQAQKNLLSLATDEGTVALFDHNVGKKTVYMESHKAPVTDLVFSCQNNPLLISVSLDRTYQCYDTAANELVLSILTDHPLSAIDMAPNGHTIAVASIRGTILIYDLRHYQSPIKQIQAHDGEIRRLLYQPAEYGSGESSINISEEQAVETSKTMQKNTSEDSFVRMINCSSGYSPRDEPDAKSDMKCRSESLGDSFLNDLSCTVKSGISTTESFVGNKPELSNLGITEGVKKWIDSRANLMDSAIPQHSPGILEAQLLPITATSSTPRMNNKLHCIQNQELQDIHSPIPAPGTSTSSVNMNDIRKIVKEVVSEVTIGQMTELMDGLSRYFLNLQLSFSKQFVNQEAALQKILMSQPSNTNLQTQVQLLKEENDFLKKKLNEKWKKGDC